MKTGQSRIELILDLTNKIGGGLKQARSQIDSEAGIAQARLKELSYRTKKGFEDVSKEIPTLRSGLISLINPTTAIIAGIGAISAGFIKATERAGEFEHRFRELSNLNLDKSRSEIDTLKDRVMDTAFAKKLDVDKVSQGFFDVQSTTGMYGIGVASMVGKQGEFAKLMQANENEYIAGSAKAMANWRFGVDELENFNRSAYATMKVGVTTFDQLAKVQSVYAGAAASINQSYDTANKTFALFTVRTKSVDEAATLTKSLFNDLTKKTTIDAFAKIGVNFFDINGKIKQTDQIMLDLNEKFSKMKNDKSVIALKNQFAGSEGLIAMIQAATDKSGNLQRTLQDFNDTKFSVDSARSEAQKDILQRQQDLAKRVDNLMIRMGQTLMPYKEDLVNMSENAVRILHHTLSSNDSILSSKVRAQEVEVYERYGGDFARIKEMSEPEFNKVHNKMLSIANLSEKEAGKITSQNDNSWLVKTGLLTADGLNRMRDYNEDYKGRFWWMAESKALKNIASEFKNQWNNRNQESTIPPIGSNATTTGLDGIDGSLNQVVGSAKTPRSITVNIDAINKGGINTSSTTLQKMDANEIDQWFSDTIFRIIRNVETSYSS